MVDNRQKMLDLIEACIVGDKKTVEFFLAKGVNINAKGKDGWTALMIACINSHYEKY